MISSLSLRGAIFLPIDIVCISALRLVNHDSSDFDVVCTVRDIYMLNKLPGIVNLSQHVFCYFYEIIHISCFNVVWNLPS